MPQPDEVPQHSPTHLSRALVRCIDAGQRAPIDEVRNAIRAGRIRSWLTEHAHVDARLDLSVYDDEDWRRSPEDSEIRRVTMGFQPRDRTPARYQDLCAWNHQLRGGLELRKRERV